jgi:hypothetical protein
MRKVISLLRLNPTWWRRLAAVAILTAVAVGAFCWGRHGGLAEAQAQQPGLEPVPGVHRVTATPGADTSDYSRRVVAYLYDNIPVTREELGEYLIARFGAERLEFLVNRKIVEMACQAKGIVVSDAEVDAQIREDLKAFGPHMTLRDFETQILKRFQKSMYEWREDVIRPKLAMQRLVRASVTVTPEDVQQAFESRYGPKVKCRMIALQKDDAHRTQIWEKVSKSEQEFLAYAKQQYVPELASRAGEIPEIHKHFPDAKIEKEAFSLKEGQVSPLIQAPDGTWIILRCEKHVPANPSKHIDQERMALSKEVFERKLAMKIPEAFGELRKAANPRILMPNPNRPTVATVNQPPVPLSPQAPANTPAPNPTIPAAPNPTVSTSGPRPTAPAGN